MPDRPEEVIDTVVRDGQRRPKLPSFQELLRAIGAFFDASGAARVSVLQGDSYFVTRFYPAQESGELQSRQFSVEELSTLADAARRHSEGDAGKGHRRSYENVLRTLGWELDEVAAATITIDELPSEFYVSWLARRPEAGLAVVKRHATVGVDALASMLQDAEGRRRPGILSAEAPDGEDPVPAP